MRPVPLTGPRPAEIAGLAPPPNDGDVLVRPRPAEMAISALQNAASLRTAGFTILDRPLSEWRRLTRLATVGSDDGSLIVTGHQPSFVHAGVWAKFVVASRLAEAVQGQALNLVVDSVTVTESVLRAPIVEDRHVSVRAVPLPTLKANRLYEQIEPLTAEQIESFRAALRKSLGPRYERTLLPLLIDGIASEKASSGLADQLVAGRRTVEQAWGIHLSDCKVSRIRWLPLLAELIENAERFLGAHNRALESYRRQHRVRGQGRPVPDLMSQGSRLELPAWAFRSNENRRRVFVKREGSFSQLWAEGDLIGEFSMQQLRDWANRCEDSCEWNGWRIRPRALMLTLWARLMLADYFIHGIGGAKYDQITDAIIVEYFGIAPPLFACVTATLRLALPVSGIDRDRIRQLRHELRDLQCNPQRWVPQTPAIQLLLARRAEAVRRSCDLREKRSDHSARAAAFDEIRSLNQAILAVCPELARAKQAQIMEALGDFTRDRLALDREYFFALFDRPQIKRLLDALPQPSDFGV